MKIQEYDKYLVSFSGGKDSLSCLFELLDAGIPREKIELWHNAIDGREEANLMDWPVTESYCEKFAEAIGIEHFFSWKVGGFSREMLRKNQRTAPMKTETPDGEIIQRGGITGKKNTRRKFPQVSGDLRVRWCSAYLKIDVFASAIRAQERFNDSRTLVLTGERAEESLMRAKYKIFELDRADCRKGKLKRIVDHYRPVHQWSEGKIWDALERYKVNPHPAYQMGWGRLSCMACIFGNDNQWASVRKIAPEVFEKIADYERQFGATIMRPPLTSKIAVALHDRAGRGQAYAGITPELAKLAMNKEYNEKIWQEHWQLPAGAFGDNDGPT